MNDRTGVLTKEHTDLILLQGNLPFDVRHIGRRRSQRGLGAGGIELRSAAGFEALRENARALLEGIGGAISDLQPALKFEQFKIGLSDFSHEGKPDAATSFLGRQE